MIDIDEIRNMQEVGVKNADWHEERRKRTKEKIPYFEGKIKEAAERGEGCWTVECEMWKSESGYDWVFLKHYFEGIGFFVSFTHMGNDYLWFTVAWDEKKIKKLRGDFIFYEDEQTVRQKLIDWGAINKKVEGG